MRWDRMGWDGMVMVMDGGGDEVGRHATVAGVGGAKPWQNAKNSTQHAFQRISPPQTAYTYSSWLN